MSKNERYEYIKVHVDCDGEVSWESKLVDNWRVARMTHDDDVSDFSEQDIRDLTVAMLDVPKDQVELIEVIYE